MKSCIPGVIAIITAACLAAEPSTQTQPVRGRLILDEGCYWQYYVEFGPDMLDADALKAKGDKLLGARGMQRLASKVKRYWRPPFARPDQARRFIEGSADWRDLARVWFPVGQGDSERAALNCYSPPPPVEWISPQFRCNWPRQRMPLMVGNMLRPSNMHGDKDMQQLCVRAAYFRTSFDLPDVDASEWILSLRFRGGARVFLNGTEIARRYLPAGGLSPDARAEVYPADAYLCRQDEVPPRQWERETRKVGAVFCEDLPGAFEDAFADGKGEYWSSLGRSRFAGYFGGWTQINRKGFQRITRLRNRRLGPVTLPRRLLRKGANLLAVEVRASHIHPVVFSDKGAEWGRAFQRVMYWSHCRLLEMELRSTSPRAPSGLSRPRGVQLWAEDMHRRCYLGDFGPGDEATPALQFVGAANGTYSAQLLVGTERELRGLKVTPGALKRLGGPGSAEIPAEAIRIGTMVAHPAGELVKLGQIRNTVEDRADPLCPPAEQAVVRYEPAARARRLSRAERLKIVGKLAYFDHIGAAAPERVAANTSQPIWVWLSVPADAAAGIYEGVLTVQAEGIDPLTVDLRAEVIAWRLPEPRRLQTILALEQSPYGVARQYGVQPWSDAHLKLLEPSFRQLARVGCDTVFVPCLQHTEFGNFEDTTIRWTRRPDGSLAFDYGILDRYLDLAVKHLGRPRVICFVVMHGVDRFGPGSQLANTVGVLHRATGEIQTLRLDADSPGYRENWKAFATSLYDHMVRRGLAESMHWGFCWDGVGDPLLPALLGELVPEVGWARSGHQGHAVGMFRFACSSLGFQFTETSLHGWNRPLPDLLCPRSGSSTLSSNGHSPPFTFRLVCDRALVAGANGIGRIGADYWADIFFRGYKGALSGGIAGMPCSYLLYGGPGGAEPSARFEALREGLQEAEARIYLEQALSRGLIQGELAERARQTLRGHNRETLYVSPGRVGVQIHEYAAGWQERSRRLYAAAAEAANAIGLDVDRTKIAGHFPARSIAPVALTLRNWTTRPRKWRAAADRPWIVLEDAAGTAAGHQPLQLRLDTRKLAPGAEAAGRLTLTDLESARQIPIDIAAQVGEVFDLVMPAYDVLGAPGHAAAWDPKRVEDHAVFNVTPGGSDDGEYALVNHSGAEFSWRAAASADWLTVAPTSGTLAPGERAFVKITARPADRQAITHRALVTVSGSAGARLERKIIAHVIPPHAPPAGPPAGRAVDLRDVPKSRIKLHKSVAYWVGSSSRRRADYGPKFGPNPQVRPGGDRAGPTDMQAAAEQITVYDIEKAVFSAFSAKVRINPAYRKPTREGHHRVRVNFEVHVDGKLAAQSGLMTPADEPRWLVAAIPADAKEVKLITRFDRPDAANLRRRVYVQWQQPRFYGH